jgi:ABC-type sugar transport system ATPase subunit
MGDRIAVMNDGRLEQVGTPEELYEHPANVFVGGFIGSPAMSFLTVAAAAEPGGAGGSGTRLRAGAVDLVVPGVDGLPSEVVVGIRPESARVWDPSHPTMVGPVAGEVAFVEALGRETFIGVDVGEDRRVVVHHDGRAALVPGDRVEFGVLPGALRYFDVADGRALPAARVAA